MIEVSSSYPKCWKKPTKGPCCNKKVANPDSCVDDLGDFTIKAVYLGGNAVVEFPLGYKFMKGVRTLLGTSAPPPKLQRSNINSSGIFTKLLYLKRGTSPFYECTCDHAR